MPEYRAVRKCFHDGRLFKPGDVLFTAAGVKVPRHFIPTPAFSIDAVKEAEVEDKKEKNLKILANKAAKADK